MEYVKRKKILLGVLVGLLFLLSVAITYAYFSLGVSGNDNATNMTAEMGTLHITYTDGVQILANDIEPGWTTTKSVTVENNGTIGAVYKFYYSNLLNEILGYNGINTNSEMHISATCISSLNIPCDGILETSVPVELSEVNNEIIKEDLFISPGEVQTYSFTFTFIETNEVQDYNQGKDFHSQLNIGEDVSLYNVNILAYDSSGNEITDYDYELHSKTITGSTLTNSFSANGIEAGTHSVKLTKDDTIYTGEFDLRNASVSGQYDLIIYLNEQTAEVKLYFNEENELENISVVGGENKILPISTVCIDDNPMHDLDNDGYVDELSHFNDELGDYDKYLAYQEIDENTVEISTYMGYTTSIVLPTSINGKTVVKIDSYAFQNNESIVSITIPCTVTEIGDAVFTDCTSLETINIGSNASIINKNAIAGTKLLSNLEENAVNDLVIWNNVLLEVINSEEVTNIIIPNGVTAIGDSAFSNCTLLESIVMPNGLKTIGNDAFYSCELLNNIIIPDSVIRIGDGAFGYCSSLENITIPKSVEYIGKEIFFYNPALKSINVDSNNLNYSSVDGILFNKNQTILINYPEAKSNSTYVIPNSVLTIGNGAFERCKALQSITIQDSVTTISEDAFNGCSSLENIIIPDSVTTMSDSAFYNCTSLQSVTLSKNIVVIEDYVFRGCSSLKNIIIPDGVTIIQRQAFYFCSSLESITIPDSVLTIELSAFARCKALQSITIPDSVTKIHSSAFSECELLENIYVDSNNLNYSSVDGVLFNKNGTELVIYPYGKGNSYVIPNNVTTIGEYAFEETAITNIVIPNSVTTIKTGAFSYCSSLESVIIGSGLINIGGSAFWNCSKLHDIYIESTVLNKLESSAFKNIANNSTIYVRNNTIAGKFKSTTYDSSKTTISDNYSWVAPTI